MNVQLGPHVELDPLKLVDSRWLVCANSGAGKSYLIRRFCEQVVRNIPTIILDREGEFATLREKFDVVLVGRTKDGAEVDTSVATAAKLARKLVELRVSAVIDLSELAKQDQRRFVRLFIESLIKLPRSMWAPMFVVIDEAHEYCPESGRDAESREAVVALMAQGRKRGLGAILATQRLSKLSKDAVSEANNVCIGRFAQDVDLRRASDILGFVGKQEWTTLRQLKPGEFYAFGPAFKNPDTTKFRCDPVITTHPKAGQRHRVTTPQPSKAILKVAPELAELQQKIEEERNELDALRKEVKELRKNKPVVKNTDEVASLRKRLVSAEEEIAAARYDGELNAVNKLWPTLQRIAEMIERMRVLTDEVRKTSARVRVKNGVKKQPRRSVDTIAALHRGSRSAVPVRYSENDPKNSRISSTTVNGELGRGAPTKLLNALLMYDEPISKGRAALLAGVAPTSSTFRNAASRLRVLGYLDDAGDLIGATDAARTKFPDAPRLPTGADLVEYWKAEMGASSAPGRLFAILADAGEPMTKEDAAAQSDLDPDTSTFRNAASRLRVLGLLVDKGGRIAVPEELTE
jgi:hypothetical protein